VNWNNVVLLAIAIVAANLPFLTERILFVVSPKDSVKHGFWRVLEILLLYFAVGGAAYLLESKLGPVQHQGWEFYAVTVCLFMVFGFPGFVYRYLWRKH
jgi:hypothetical protein